MPKLEADPDLQFQADKSGMIHVRKHPGESKILPGYGTSEFGISGYEPVKKFTPATFLLSGGIIGSLAWLFRDKIKENLQVWSDYALLLRESSRS